MRRSWPGLRNAFRRSSRPVRLIAASVSRRRRAGNTVGAWAARRPPSVSARTGCNWRSPRTCGTWRPATTNSWGAALNAGRHAIKSASRSSACWRGGATRSGRRFLWSRNPTFVAGRSVFASSSSISLVLLPIRFRLPLGLTSAVKGTRPRPLFGGALIDVLNQPRANAHTRAGEVHKHHPLGCRRLVERGLDGLSHLTADVPLLEVRYDEEVVNRWLGLARSLESLLGVLHGPLAATQGSPSNAIAPSGNSRGRGD